MAMCLIVLADKNRTASRSSPAAPEPPPFEKVWPAVLRAHEPAGGILGHLWRLPSEINVVVSSHHGVNSREKDNVLAAAVCVADWIATELGYAVQGEVSALPRDAVRMLALSETTLADIKLQARGVVARID